MMFQEYNVTFSFLYKKNQRVEKIFLWKLLVFTNFLVFYEFDFLFLLNLKHINNLL